MPLTGVRVVDLTRIISGPFCTMLLADMGAEVVKVEPPEGGDPLRVQGHVRDGLSWYFANFNRNKKSVALDLYAPEGREVLSELIRRADVLVDNFRPGVLAKMSFTEARLHELNPRLLQASVTGFGEDGPYAERPAFDFIAQAMSGLMMANGRAEDPPMRVATPLSDLVAGLYAAFGIVAALHGRMQTGKGQKVGSSLLSGLVSFSAYLASNYFATGKMAERSGNDHPIAAPYGLFRTKDGHIGIAPSTEAVFHRLVDALGMPELKEDPDLQGNARRVRQRERLNRLVQDKLLTDTSQSWIERLNDAGVPCGPILDISQVFEDPQIRSQEMAIDVPHPGYGIVRMLGFPVKLSATPCRARLPAPRLGEHTREMLESIGFDAVRIAALQDKKVIG
jgi:CoA:oxalate CoA-transferase